MAKFYYYRDEGSDGIYWKGQYHYTVKEAGDGVRLNQSALEKTAHLIFNIINKDRHLS